MFNGSLRVCRILRFVKKIRFCLLESGRTKAWCPGLVSRRVPKHRNQWQEIEGLLFSPKTLSWCIFWAFIPRVWFPYSSFQQVLQPSIPSPVEEDTSKIRDTIGTIFIQGPYIVLLVWRSIMFNGSFLRVSRILWFVKKLDFAFLSLGGPSHCAWVWCLGRVTKHRNQWQEIEGLLCSPKNSQWVHIYS